MVRAYWIGPLLVALAVTGLALSQTSTPAVVNPPGSPKERIVTVGDLGKPGQKCRVLKTWTMPNGHPAYQVQALDTGELITIEESASAASPARFGLFHAHETRIFHWGGDAQMAPHGSPVPPPNAVVLAKPFPVNSKAAVATVDRLNPAKQAKEPFPVHSKAVVATVTTAPEKTQVKKWPAAFVVKKPGDGVPVASETRLTPAAPPAAKNGSLTPQHPAPVVAKALRPIAPPLVKSIELTPFRPTSVAVKAAPTAPVASTSVVNKSPYNPDRSEAAVAKTPASKQPVAIAHQAEGSGYPQVKSPYQQIEVQPATHGFWNTARLWKPAEPTPAPVKPSASPAVKAPTTSAVKDVATTAQPGDWRESWGKIPAPKPAPVHNEERSAKVAAPMIELPHAVVKADDPLKTPEKFATIPESGAYTDAPVKKNKKPFLAFLAPKPPEPAPVVEKKKPEEGLVTKKPSTPTAPVAAVTPAAVASPTVVRIPPPAPDQLIPPAATKAPPPPAPLALAPPAPFTLPPITKALQPAPVQATPVASQIKTETKPTVPLGMQSVLAARSPELAPPMPRKPVVPSQAQAMGVNANEANAFTEPPARGTAAAASNGFWTPNRPATEANPGRYAVAWRPPAAPAGYAPSARVAAVSPVIQAAYRQNVSTELAQLSVLMHESVYPSQREWAAERLASFDWRQQPQAVELLVERAKQDPAPGVRAECLRSLVRMKCDAPDVTATVKACQSDADPQVRQAANQAN